MKRLSQKAFYSKNLTKEFSLSGAEVDSGFRQENHLAESMLTKIKEIEPDLIIESTHHNRLRRTIITNTDCRLIRKCPTPFLLVKPNGWSRDAQLVDQCQGEITESMFNW